MGDTTCKRCGVELITVQYAGTVEEGGVNTVHTDARCADRLKAKLAILQSNHDDVVSCFDAAQLNNSRLAAQLREVTEHAEALDRNWATLHNAGMDSIRDALSMPNATVPEMTTAIATLDGIREARTALNAATKGGGT